MSKSAVAIGFVVVGLGAFALGRLSMAPVVSVAERHTVPQSRESVPVVQQEEERKPSVDPMTGKPYFYHPSYQEQLTEAAALKEAEQRGYRKAELEFDH